MSIAIMLVDDHSITVEGLRALLDREIDMEVVGVARTGREGVQLAGVLKPDIVVLDISMPDLNGVEATRQILNQNSHIQVIALTMHKSRRFLVAMLQAGAMGYVVKSQPPDELITAIRTVLHKRRFISDAFGDITNLDIATMHSQSDESVVEKLTKRELEVLQMLITGLGNRQISEQLSMSIKTVETHRQHITEKLGISNVADLTRFAIREGLISVGSVPLTSREREVLQLVAEGKSTVEIANILCLSINTITTHRQNIMDKLHIHNIAELTLFAVREGLASAD